MFADYKAIYKEFTPRNIYALTNNSLTRQLERCAWFGQTPTAEQIRNWNEDLHWALRTGRFDKVQTEILSVKIDADKTATVPISFVNNQFRAADAQAYPYGHDADVLAAIDLFLPDDGVFFDIGASWGTFSFAIALRAGFTGKIHAFEPLQMAADDFRRILPALPIHCDLTLHQLGMSDRMGPANLILCSNSGGNVIGDNGPGQVGEEIELAPLDRIDLPSPSVIKMDVESHEAATLRGAIQTIKRAQPIIIFESWLKFPSEVVQTMDPFLELHACGYAFYCPAWLDRHGRVSRHPDGGPNGPRFALVPFRSEQRLTLAEGMNVVALPAGQVLAGWKDIVITDLATYPFVRSAPLFG